VEVIELFACGHDPPFLACNCSPVLKKPDVIETLADAWVADITPP
jgi:hypothetical protein